MARVKGGKMAQKRRRNILDEVKGYRFARSKKSEPLVKHLRTTARI